MSLTKAEEQIMDTNLSTANKQEKIQGIIPESGISEQELNEFYNTIEKHTTYSTNKKGRTDLIVDMPPKTADKIYILFS